jgi:hypothetical protein
MEKFQMGPKTLYLGLFESFELASNPSQHLFAFLGQYTYQKLMNLEVTHVVVQLQKTMPK